jgi:cytochrome c biogenesis protein CcmG, thiol:disulfide interchange protein DsbE
VKLSTLCGAVILSASIAAVPGRAVGGSGRQAGSREEAGATAASALKAADFTAKDLLGQPVVLADLLRQGPVFLHFWTTWCPSCQREMAKLDQLDRTYRDRGFHVVAIAQDDQKTMQKVKPLVASKKFVMTVIVDSKKEIGNRYSVRQYPTCFLIAKDGAIAHYAQGYIPGDENRLESLVRGLLGLDPDVSELGK